MSAPKITNPAVVEPLVEKPKTGAKLPVKAAVKPASKVAVKPASKVAAKPASKVAAKPATKTAVKPTAKVAAKSASKPVVKPPAKAPVKPATKPAGKANGAAMAETKLRKPKVVQASFTLHEDEHTVLKDLKQACKLAATNVKKSELVRAALMLLKKLDVATVKALVEHLPALKTSAKNKA
jgi:hypothetical protein